MTERLKKLVSAIESIAESFTADRNADEKNYWNDWFSDHRHLAMNIFVELKDLQRECRQHPDYMAVLTSRQYVDREGLTELVERIDDAKERFFTIALPVMIRDTRASKVKNRITKLEEVADDRTRGREITKWSLLASDKSLNDEAWAHIGKELTYRLFTDVHAKENRRRGRPKKDVKDKHIYVAKRVIELKRKLYRPFYRLAPFTDVEVVDALLSDHKNEKLVSILKDLGLSNLVTKETVCNMISAGRGDLSGFWLVEDFHYSGSNDEYFSDEAISINERIKGAESLLGPLTKLDKYAISNGFACPTEIRRALDRDSLMEVDLEKIMLWNLMPEQIMAVMEKAKSLFNLSEFKHPDAQAKASDYW